MLFVRGSWFLLEQKKKKNQYRNPLLAQKTKNANLLNGPSLQPTARYERSDLHCWSRLNLCSDENGLNLPNRNDQYTAKDILQNLYSIL